MSSLNEILNLIKSGNIDKLRETITANPSAANLTTDQGISLLQFAAYCRNKSAIVLLRSYQANVNIYEAASIGDGGIVRQMTDLNPELINSFSPDGFTPLGLASFFGHMDVVKLLLSKGADPNIASNNDFKVAPLHSACAISHYEIAEMLVKNGADVNARQMNGVTPLHSAAHNGQSRLAKLLIESGSDINAKMDNGQTPLFMAEEKGFNEIAQMIQQSGGR